MKVVLIATESIFFKGRQVPMALIKICGLSLLERVVYNLNRCGFDDFIIVTGFKAEIVENFAFRVKLHQKFKLRFLRNEEYEKGIVQHINSKTKDLFFEDFLIMNVGTIFDKNFVERFLKVKSPAMSVNLASKNSKNNVVIPNFEIGFLSKGKFFYWNKQLLQQLLQKDKGNEQYSLLYFKIENQDSIKKAEKLLISQTTYVGVNEDIIISKIVRPSSKLLVKIFVKTPITPNQISFFNFLLLTIVGILASFGRPFLMVLAGIILLLGMIVDCADGEVARLKFMDSKYGAWFDSKMDRLGSLFMFTGITVGLYNQMHSVIAWIAGFALILTKLLNIYISSPSIGSQKQLNKEMKVRQRHSEKAMIKSLWFLVKQFVKKYRLDSFGWGIGYSIVVLGLIFNQIFYSFILYTFFLFFVSILSFIGLNKMLKKAEGNC